MIEETVDITTADGPMETFLCRPERGGPYPAVIFLMDAHGVREELRDMARRLAAVGYYVLLPNLYYRAGRDTIFGPDVSGELYIACAEHDALAPLPMVEELRGWFTRAGVAGEIEMYLGVHHGFAFSQRWCYDKPAAERHWERLLALYRRRLHAR